MQDIMKAVLFAEDSLTPSCSLLNRP